MNDADSTDSVKSTNPLGDLGWFGSIMVIPDEPKSVASVKPVTRAQRHSGLTKAEQRLVGVVLDGCGYHSRIGCDQTGTQYSFCYPTYRKKRLPRV